jgi:hypothetical protein
MLYVYAFPITFFGGNPNAVGLSAVSDDNMAKVRTFEAEATLPPLTFGSRNDVQ